MELNKQSVNLVEVAIPVNEYIGKISYLGYDTLIMIKTGTVTTLYRKKETLYNYSEGYINLTKFEQDFKRKHPDEQTKRINDWNKSNKKQIKEFEEMLRSEDLRFATSIKIKGGTKQYITLQGTYFHPDLVHHVLNWCNPKMADIMKNIINNHIYDENLRQQNQQITVDQLLPFNQEYHIKNDVPEECKTVQSEVKIDVIPNEYVDKLKEIQCSIADLNDLKNKTKNKQQKIQLLEQISSLQTQETELKLKLNDCKWSVMYHIIDKQINIPIYAGIMQLQDNLDQNIEQERFWQHKQKAAQIIKNHSMLHVFMAGKLVEQMAKHGQTNCSLSMFDSIFECLPVQEGHMKREMLETHEQAEVTNLQKKGITILNMRKVLFYRSQSRSQTDSQSKTRSRSKINQCPVKSQLQPIQEEPVTITPSKQIKSSHITTNINGKWICSDCNRVVRSEIGHQKCPKQ